jgi:phosphopantetheinyl transferase
MNAMAPDTDGEVHRWSLGANGSGAGRAEVLAVRVGQLDAEPLLATLGEAEQRRSAHFKSPHRRHEYIVSRWLIHQLEDLGPVSISHCRRWIAVAATPGAGIGLDVESRLPRHLDQVAERLGWNGIDADQYLQAWTLWEAWRKLEGGSVLDEPDAVYHGALADRTVIMEDGAEIDGTAFRSLPLAGGCLSVAVKA